MKFLYWAERAGSAIAARLIDAIVDRFWILGQYPDAGRPCIDIAPGVKCFQPANISSITAKFGAE